MKDSIVPGENVTKFIFDNSKGWRLPVRPRRNDPQQRATRKKVFNIQFAHLTEEEVQRHYGMPWSASSAIRN